jgi:putative acetyltransferase
MPAEGAPGAEPRVVAWEPARSARLAEAFEALNRAWIERHFVVEAADRAVFADPEGTIRAPGGEILFVLEDERIVGTCALILHAPGTFELAKMAVDPSAQGRGHADRLMIAALDWARAHGAERVMLVTNSALTPALRLYAKHGFRRVAVDPANEYARADVQMELALGRDAPRGAARGVPAADG